MAATYVLRQSTYIRILRLPIFIIGELLTFYSHQFYHQHTASDETRHQVNHLQAKVVSYISTLPVTILITKGSYVPPKVVRYISILLADKFIIGGKPLTA